MKKTIAKKTKKAKKLIAKPAAIVAFLSDLFADELEVLNRKNIAMHN